MATERNQNRIVKAYFRNQFYRFELSGDSLESFPKFCDAIEEKIPEMKSCTNASFLFLGSNGEKAELTNEEELRKAARTNEVLRLLIQESKTAKEESETKPKPKPSTNRPVPEIECCVCKTTLSRPGIDRFQCVSCPGVTLCSGCEKGEGGETAKRTGIFAEQSHDPGHHVMLKLHGWARESGSGQSSGTGVQMQEFLDQLQDMGLLPPMESKDRNYLSNLADIASQVMSSLCAQQSSQSKGSGSETGPNSAGTQNPAGSVPCAGMGGMAEMINQFMTSLSQQQGAGFGGAGFGNGTSHSAGQNSLNDVLGGLAAQFMASPFGAGVPPCYASCARDAGPTKSQATLQHLLDMGFTNEDDWLLRLVEAKRGDIGAVLDALKGPSSTNLGASTSTKA